MDFTNKSSQIPSIDQPPHVFFKEVKIVWGFSKMNRSDWPFKAEIMRYTIIVESRLKITILLKKKSC